MIIETESRKELERLVAVLSLGLCTAVESNCLSSEEAESYLFNRLCCINTLPGPEGPGYTDGTPFGA